MFVFKKCRAAVIFSGLAFVSFLASAQSDNQPKRIIQPLAFQQVKVDDGFWSPKMKVWTTKTVYDVFDKLEGKYEPDRPDIVAEKARLGRTRNAFLNFDMVAQGKKNAGNHDGPHGMTALFTKPSAALPTCWRSTLIQRLKKR